MAICASCGQDNPEGFKFCGACGASLELTAPVREERKVVTVLFADLVGFTSRAERMDPEDVRALLAPYHAHLRSELERYGGTVEKFIGDAVMALFGAPVAHEDDPERAVRAALAIRDWVREQEEELQLRIAVNTGEALIALGARPEAGEGMASGDVVNTTARLQSAAPVNGILVGETTYRATRDVIDYREAEPVEAKGKQKPIVVWEAGEPRARVGVGLPQRIRSPLVGRERELEVLRNALDRVREERLPQLVTLVGVPGIGKSRLIYELMQFVERGGELTYWRQGRSLPYGEGVIYWALAEMVKAQAGILETDTDDEVQRKLKAAVRDLLADTTEADWIEAHMRPLAGLSAESELGGDRRNEDFAAWRRFFEAMAGQRPLILVFEDLQWADDDLFDFVDHLVEWAGSFPMLVICSARPELLERRPGWGGGKLNATTLSLSPLSNDETARLLAGLRDQPLLMAETQQALLARAGGNPLYAEQYAQMLSESGDALELRLPESLQGLIAARLDLLPPEEKVLLQDAAVLGKVFWLGGLVDGRSRQEVEQRLHTLERKGFVERARRSSVGDEAEYAFRHLLVREVSYAQIPRAARAEKHRLASDWIESLGKPEDHAEMLAHHYLNGLEYARALGRKSEDLAERARIALVHAGDRALVLNAFAAAARFYRDALGLSTAADPGQARILFRLGEALLRIGDQEARYVLDEARTSLLDAADAETAAEADALLAELWWHRGERDRCSDCLHRAHDVVRSVPASRSKARVLSHVARFRMLAEENGEAIRVGREALAIAEELGLEQLRAHVLNTIGMARYMGGDDDGVADVEQSLEVALEANAADAATRAEINLAALHQARGDLRRHREAVAEGIQLAERFGDIPALLGLQTHDIQGAYAAGDWQSALRLADEFIAERESGSPNNSEVWARGVRGAVRLACGDGDGALEDAASGLAVARRAKDPQMVVPALALSARVHAELGRTDEARRIVHELLSQPGGLVWLRVDVAWVAQRLGLEAELRRQLDTMHPSLWLDALRAVLAGEFERAVERFAEIGSVPDEALARLRAAEHLLAKGRTGAADNQLRPALAFWRSVGAACYIREGEALLAASA
jgi:class 3 adenylate cyclase/tetratricopeptide (TPR) repeat protein